MARYSLNDLGASVEKNFPNLKRGLAAVRGRFPAVANTAGKVPAMPLPPSNLGMLGTPRTNDPPQFSSGQRSQPTPHAVENTRVQTLNRGNNHIQAPIRRNP